MSQNFPSRTEKLPSSSKSCSGRWLVFHFSLNSGYEKTPRKDPSLHHDLDFDVKSVIEPNHPPVFVIKNDGDNIYHSNINNHAIRSNWSSVIYHL